MVDDKYKQFRKITSSNILCLDFCIDYDVNKHKNLSLDFIILFKGIYTKNNIKNNFSAKTIITFDKSSKNEVSVKKFDITSIACCDRMTNNNNIIEKYCSDNINVLSCFSEEYDCDYEGDVYCLLEQILSKTVVNFSDNKLIFNMKLLNNDENEFIESLSLKILKKNSVSIVEIVNKTIKKSTNDIFAFIVLAIIFTCYFIYNNNNKLLFENPLKFFTDKFKIKSYK
jgi:hypothetical protein